MIGRLDERRVRSALQVATPALVVALAWFVVVAVVTNRSISGARADADALVATQLALVDQLTELQTLEQWRSDLEVEQARLLASVPETPRLDVFVRSLADLASEAGVAVEQLAPVSVQSAMSDGGGDLPTGVTAIELSITAAGRYGSLMTFLRGLQTSDRLVVIDSLSVLADDENPDVLTLDLLVRVFTLQEAASVTADSAAFDAFETADAEPEGEDDQS